MRLCFAIVAASVVLGACQSGAVIGTSCARDSECASPLVCRLGRCRNACTANRDCPVGSQCFLGADGLGACQLDQDRTCGASCSDPLTCLGGQCVRTCVRAVDCPSDGECAIGSGTSIGLCIDPRSGDGGLVDAPASDAGTAACRPAQHVCAGEGFTCALFDDDSVACWGDDASAQSGAASAGVTCDGEPCRLVPTRVVDRAGAAIHATQIACGEGFACALAIDGHLQCWGSTAGLLRADGESGATPFAGATYFDGVAHIPWGEGSAPHPAMLALGRSHACALTGDHMDGRCWGDDTYGELGDGMARAGGQLPVRPSVLFAALTAPFRGWVLGDGITCLVDATDRVRCVGHSASGELGPGVAVGSDAILAVVDPGLPSHVVLGDQFACARASDGVVSCIGTNGNGELGRDTGRVATSTPAPVAGTTTFDTLVSGPTSSTTFALHGTDVYAWGLNYHGVAAGDSGNRLAPEWVASLAGSTEIAVSGGHGCAIGGNGALSCWGANGVGQLGRGAMGPDDPTPRPACIVLP